MIFTYKRNNAIIFFLKSKYIMQYIYLAIIELCSFWLIHLLTYKTCVVDEKSTNHIFINQCNRYIACKTQSHHALKWNRGSNKFGDICTNTYTKYCGWDSCKNNLLTIFNTFVKTTKSVWSLVFERFVYIYICILFIFCFMLDGF